VLSIYDISSPANTALLTSLVCPGGQGDVSVYKNLLFMSSRCRMTAGLRHARISVRNLRRPRKSKKTRTRTRKKATHSCSAEGPLPRRKNLRHFRHQKIRNKSQRCRRAAARIRILWSWIRTIKKMSTSTCRERRLCVSRKNWPAARAKNRTKTRTRRLFRIEVIKFRSPRRRTRKSSPVLACLWTRGRAR